MSGQGTGAFFGRTASVSQSGTASVSQSGTASVSQLGTASRAPLRLLTTDLLTRSGAFHERLDIVMDNGYLLANR
jgi:hypothetical protein